MKSFLKSFKYAATGLKNAVKTGKNLRFMLFFAALVFCFAIPVFENALQWALLFAVTGVTLAAEIFNTSIERLCDRVCRERDLDIKFVKDTAAGAVLVLSIFDAAAGICLFVTGGRFMKIIRYSAAHPIYAAAVIILLILVFLSVILRGKRND